MKAVILAGGRGTRLAPITFILPKPLVPVGDMAILEVVMRQLRHHGFTEVTLTLGYLAELIQAFFHQHKALSQALNLRTVVEEKPTGTAGSVAAVPGLREGGEPFLVMNGDILTTLDYRALMDAHRAAGADLTIATYHKRHTIDLGVLELSEGDTPGHARVVGYREKPSHTYPVSMGIYVYNPEVLDLIQPGEYLDFPTLVLRLIERGGYVQAYESDAIWLDIGRPEDYIEAQRLFAERQPEFLPPL